MNSLIIGAGAIGCLVGAKLALKGHDVTLVGRTRFAAAVAERGLLLHDEHGQQQISGVATATSLQQAFSTGTAYDYAVLTVKSYDTAAALEELERLPGIVNGLTLLSLQNGVGNEESLAASLSPSRVVAGTITTPVSSSEPGNVLVEKPDYCVGLSPWHPAVSSTIYNTIHKSFAEAGFTVTDYPHAKGMKWTKLLMNTVGNATCAILDAPPDWVFEQKQLANLEIEAWRETLSVMRTADIPPVNIGSYPFTLLAPIIRTAPRLLLRRALNKSVGQARGGKMPSLHIDLSNGRTKTEVGWLNGSTVRKGEEMDIPTPINRMLTDVLTQLVAEPHKWDGWRRNASRLLDTAEKYRRAS